MAMKSGLNHHMPRRSSRRASIYPSPIAPHPSLSQVGTETHKRNPTKIQILWRATNAPVNDSDNNFTVIVVISRLTQLHPDRPPAERVQVGILFRSGNRLGRLVEQGFRDGNDIVKVIVTGEAACTEALRAAQVVVRQVTRVHFAVVENIEIGRTVAQTEAEAKTQHEGEKGEQDKWEDNEEEKSASVESVADVSSIRRKQRVKACVEFGFPTVVGARCCRRWWGCGRKHGVHWRRCAGRGGGGSVGWQDGPAILLIGAGAADANRRLLVGEYRIVGQ